MHYVEDYNIFLSSKKNGGMFMDWCLLNTKCLMTNLAILINLKQKNNIQFYILAFHDHMIPILQVHSF